MLLSIRTKQHLKIVRKFGAACIAGIHRDTDIAHRIQIEFRAFENKLLDVTLDCPDDAQDLHDTHKHTCRHNTNKLVLYINKLHLESMKLHHYISSYIHYNKLYR